MIMPIKRQVVLTIMDGWGINPEIEGNAIALAGTPNLDYYRQKYQFTKLQASGEGVGLPPGQMGNSEVGHLNMGAGRVVYQEFTRISLAIKRGDFFNNPVLGEVMGKVKGRGSALHLMGLLSDGGVHSHQDHLYALLEMARQQGVSRAYVHAFLDGRDVPPANARVYLKDLKCRMERLGLGTIATIGGRYYAMDRDNRWERVEKAYRSMVYGEGEVAANCLHALEKAYDRGQTDEFVMPMVILDEQGEPRGTIKSGDGVIFFNFRPDRARQITRAFVDEVFPHFPRVTAPQVDFVTLTRYAKNIEAPVAFPPQDLTSTLGEVLSRAGLKQLKIAETEKYAHVTFFFNGGVEKPLPGEERVLVPSPQVATYNLKPEMSALELTEKVVEKIREGVFDVMVINYANPDMVGHTGILEAAVRAVETVDRCVGRVVEELLARGGIMLLTADHGNAEQMLDRETGQPHTAHTSNPVPFYLIGNQEFSPLREGTLADVAPTILDILGIELPPEMTGSSLLA